MLINYDYVNLLLCITQPYKFRLFRANKMASEVSEGILGAEHEFSITSAFREKRGWNRLKLAFFTIFEQL